MKKKCQEKSKTGRLISVFQSGLLAGILLLCILQIAGIGKQAIDFALPMLGAYQLFAGATTYRKDRDSAFVSLLAGAVILLIFVSGFLPA